MILLEILWIASSILSLLLLLMSAVLFIADVIGGVLFGCIVLCLLLLDIALTVLCAKYVRNEFLIKITVGFVKLLGTFSPLKDAAVEFEEAMRYLDANPNSSLDAVCEVSDDFHSEPLVLSTSLSLISSVAKVLVAFALLVYGIYIINIIDTSTLFLPEFFVTSIRLIPINTITGVLLLFLVIFTLIFAPIIRAIHKDIRIEISNEAE